MEHSDTARQIIYVAFDNAMFLIVILTKTFCNKSCIPKDKNSAIII
jgi:methylphosphotriester-DNA--protein-cysteine methyltransferase